jgi:hypothetical protein
MLVSILFLLSACSSTPTPDLDATIQAGIEQTNAAAEAEPAQIEEELPTATELSTEPPPTEETPPEAATPTELPEAGTVTCPLYVYADWGSDLNHYTPAGFMGDTDNIDLDDNYQLDSERPNVIQIIYTPGGSQGWAGIYWWDPPDSDWGKVDGGFDLSCATKLAFWAKGENGGEKAEFKVGGLKGDYQDSLQPAETTGPIVLTENWIEYSIDLAGKDLSHIIGGFVWVTNDTNGGTIYLDDIIFE